MEHQDARDDFDPSTAAGSTEGGGFSTATGAGTSMGARPVSPPAAEEGQEAEPDTETASAPEETAPDLPVRASADQPEDTDRLPLGESDIEDRLRAAQRVQHRDATEPDSAFG